MERGQLALSLGRPELMRQEVGARSLESLIAVLQHDAPFDTEIAKAALETLMQLSEVAEKVSLPFHVLHRADFVADER